MHFRKGEVSLESFTDDRDSRIAADKNPKGRIESFSPWNVKRPSCPRGWAAKKYLTLRRRPDPEGLWQYGDLERQAAHHLAVEVDQGLDAEVEAEGGAARRPHLGMVDMGAAVELGQDA